MVGGVEAVIQAHTITAARCRLPGDADCRGRGEELLFPKGAEFIQIPEMDSRHPQIVQASQQLEAGKVPDDFEALSTSLEKSLGTCLAGQWITSSSTMCLPSISTCR